MTILYGEEAWRALTNGLDKSGLEREKYKLMDSIISFEAGIRLQEMTINDATTSEQRKAEYNVLCVYRMAIDILRERIKEINQR